MQDDLPKGESKNAINMPVVLMQLVFPYLNHDIQLLQQTVSKEIWLHPLYGLVFSIGGRAS